MSIQPQKAKLGDVVGANVIRGSEVDNRTKFGGVFKVTCYGADGQLKWEDEFHNLVVNEGLQDLNNKYFKGSTYTAAWYLGLVTGPGANTTYTATDTLASHGATGSGGWTEFTNYSGNRKAVTFGTPTLADPSVISNSASPSVFAITSSGGTVAGAFLASVDTGTSGILFSEGDFTGGDKIVASGDTLNVTYTFNADAA
jgi:hypothetical protein